VDSNVVQSKVLVDPLLRGLLEEKRKIDPHIFWGDPKNKFEGTTFRNSLGYALRASPITPKKYFLNHI
jgi:hypothetical protein